MIRAYTKNILFILVSIISYLFRIFKYFKPRFIKHPENKYLIVTADDFCISSEVNLGIVEAFEKGIVTTTSALINFPDSVKMLKDIENKCPDLPIGIHLNITAGKPVLNAEKVPSLVDENGNFYSNEGIPKHLTKMKLDEVRSELYAQIERFLSTGVKLDHIDYHHHMLPFYSPFYNIVIELAKRYQVPVRNPIPNSFYGDVWGGKGFTNFKAILNIILFIILHPITSLRLLEFANPISLTKSLGKLNHEGIKSPDWFIESFYGNADVDSLTVILKNLPVGVSELMTHPGKKSKTGEAKEYLYREMELEVLKSPEIRRVIEEQGIKLDNYSFFY